MINLPISIDWKGDSYNSILVIVNWLTMMVYYKSVKITINISGLAEVIINMLIYHHGFLDSIVTNQGSFFTLKFWSLLCYFFSIKRWLFTSFYPQTDNQTKKQKSKIKAYLWVFVNFEQNNEAKLLTMAVFAYNISKNASIDYASFKLNCAYPLCVIFEKDTDLCS